MEKSEYIKALFINYPILQKIDKENNGVITEQSYFRSLYSDEYIAGAGKSCNGIIFVLEGIINIQKINEDGEQTNLYNIERGEFCHEALSCISTFGSLNITGKAIQYSEICIIPQDIVKKYIMKDQEFSMYIYGDLYKKFKSIIENKEELIHEGLKKRLIKLLISKNSKVIYTTHSELALEVASAREVVSRNLKSIENQGYIKLSRGKITILKDLNELLNKLWWNLRRS